MDGESAVPIWLQIWRPVDANPNVYTLEWEHEFSVDHSNPSGVFYEVAFQNRQLFWYFVYLKRCFQRCKYNAF